MTEHVARISGIICHPITWGRRATERVVASSPAMRRPIDKGTALTCRPHIGLIHP